MRLLDRLRRFDLASDMVPMMKSCYLPNGSFVDASSAVLSGWVSIRCEIEMRPRLTLSGLEMECSVGERYGDSGTVERDVE